MGMSVSNTLSIRQFYAKNFQLVTPANREKSTTGTLSFADSAALRNAIRQLGDYNFKDSSNDDLSEKIKAFADTYNNTISSATKYSHTDRSLNQTVKKMKDLSTEYADELAKFGITIDDKGKMEVSGTAAKNVAHEKFESLLGKDSKYMNSLYDIAKKISTHVDIKL